MVLSVCASTMVGERCAMWTKVFQLLPIDCRWIMTGDFNMVESLLDRCLSSCSHLMGFKEEFAWENIKNKCNIEEYFNRTDGPIYLWENLRDGGIRIIARLDRFHSFASSVQSPSSRIMQFKILGDSTRSYHHHASFLINLSHASGWFLLEG